MKQNIIDRKITDIALIVPEVILALFLCDIADLILTVCIFNMLTTLNERLFSHRFIRQN
jgi:hypothetical protein